MIWQFKKLTLDSFLYLFRKAKKTKEADDDVVEQKQKPQKQGVKGEIAMGKTLYWKNSTAKITETPKFHQKNLSCKIHEIIVKFWDSK